MKNLYEVTFYKGDNVLPNTYNIPAETEQDALVRLGQIYGDDKTYREDLEIKVVGISLVMRG